MRENRAGAACKHWGKIWAGCGGRKVLVKLGVESMITKLLVILVDCVSLCLLGFGLK